MVGRAGTHWGEVLGLGIDAPAFLQASASEGGLSGFDQWARQLGDGPGQQSGPSQISAIGMESGLGGTVEAGSHGEARAQPGLRGKA